MFPLHSPKQNRILAALAAEDYARLLPYMELIATPVGQVINKPGASVTHLYFPTTSIVAPVCSIENGASVRLAIIGNEGFTGTSCLFGGDGMSTGVIVQSAGNGYRVKATVLQKEFDRRGKFQQLALHYTQALITQTAQNAVCNRHHNIEQQLGRFLLMSLDRLSSDEMQMTHEQIAMMLGVRRESVTQAALKLQTIGAIRYSRGHITVVDREELEDSVCECYAVVNCEYHRLLPYHSVFDLAPPKRHVRKELWTVN
jgi:CRP-like cAMP-binding protein